MCSEYGCSQLTVAVVHRDQFEVERLIREGHDVNDAISPPFSPLCLAVEWDLGINTLLKAEAYASTAVHEAIFYDKKTCLQSLLNSGSCLEVIVVDLTTNPSHGIFFDAPPPYLHAQTFWTFSRFAYSLLSFALWRKRTQRMTTDTITSLIVQAMAASRQKVMELARKYVSIPDLKRCGWNDPSNNDLVCNSVAMELARSIQKMKIDVPPALWPGIRRSVYHDEWMTANVAERLFSAGFKHVDLRDEVGRTPLIANLHFTRSNILERVACLSWFLSRGAERVVIAEMNGKSIVHVLAANLGSAWWTEPPWDRDARHYIFCEQAKACLPSLLDRIFSISSVSSSSHSDTCQCFCSHSGCLPVHDLVKHMSRDFLMDDWPDTLWSTWHSEQEVLSLWSQCCATNPEKDFERSEICRI